ncbi:MAG TPA: hypothetical protein VE397_11135 [Stellaceae bacterium]|jgi:hypothetical protein|nr:hypothetical protein [Stellaceae bacterium]
MSAICPSINHPEMRDRVDPQDRGRVRSFLRRLPTALWIVLAIMVSWSAEYVTYRVFAPPAVALRHELVGAAGELDHNLVPLPDPGLASDIRRHFREADVAVNVTQRWPNVAVTLGGIPHAGCVAALHEDRRIDGLVVIALQGYRSARDCGESNDMTWWLMP